MARSNDTEVLDFNSNMTRAYFAQLVDAMEVAPRSPQDDPVAALVSIFSVPKLDNGQSAFSTRLARELAAALAWQRQRRGQDGI